MLVVVDLFSKMSHLEKTTNALTIANFFFQKIVCLYGILKTSIISWH